MTTPSRAGSGPLHLLAVFYAAMAGLALYGQSDGLMAWLGVPRLVALGVALAVELLAAVLFAFADWRRTRHGEQAYAARTLSVAVAAGVAAMNFYGHEANPALRALFTGASLAGYGVWVLHTNARRRDALRAAGRLAGQAPVFGISAWLRAPRMIWRARQLAVADPSLSVHTAISKASTDQAREARQAAIAAALRRKLAASLDGVSAEIAMVSYDLDEVAARLAASVDYDRLTGLLAADIHPDRIAAGRPTKRHATNLDPDATVDGGHIVDADKPQPRPRSTPRRVKTVRPDAAARVRTALAAHPNATQAEIARVAATSTRTVRRVLSAARKDIDALDSVGVAAS